MEAPTRHPLPDEILDRRATLPPRPAAVELSGSIVRLSPIDPARDAGPLFAIANGEPVALGARACEAYDPDAMIWRYLPRGPFADVDALTAQLHALAGLATSRMLCVREKTTDRPIGVVSLMNNEPSHLKIELGNIWYGPIAQGSGANTETTFLLLDQVFGLGYRRVEWKCNARNERSRRSALRMGFQFEGIQEAHLIVKGENRDTAWFRILDREWPAVRTRLDDLRRLALGF